MFVILDLCWIKRTKSEKYFLKGYSTNLLTQIVRYRTIYSVLWKGMVTMPNKSKLDKVINQLPIADERSVRVLISLVQMSHEIYNEMSSKLARFGLTQGKFRILLVLFKKNEPLKPSELAQHTGVTRSTMTGLIDGLERDGFIRRGDHEDRRMTTIHLTEEGRELMNRLFPYYVEHSACLLSELTEDDHAVLAKLLKKLQKGLEHIKET